MKIRIDPAANIDLMSTSSIMLKLVQSVIPIATRAMMKIASETSSSRQSKAN